MTKIKQLKNSVRKLRPLGLVRNECAHFQRLDTDSDDSVLDIKTAVIRDTCHFMSCQSSGDFHRFSQMSSIRETLRQVAVANVVASASRELIADEMQLLNSVSVSGPAGDTVRTVLTDRDTSFTDSRGKDGAVFSSMRENTSVSLVPPAPPNTASATAAPKSLTSERSPPVPSTRQIMGQQGNLEMCLQSTSINNKENVTTTLNARRRNRNDNDFKSTSSLASSDTVSVDKLPKEERCQFVTITDVRVNTDSTSLSSYALCGTGFNQQTPKDNISRNIDMLSTRSSLDTKTRYGSSVLTSEDISSQFMGEDRKAKGVKLSSNQNHNTEIKMSGKKNQYGISYCSAVDIDDSITSYVLRGLPTSVYTSNRSSAEVGGLDKNKSADYQTLPSITNSELITSANVGLTESPSGTSDSTDFTEGLRIVSLNHFYNTTTSPNPKETGPRGPQQAQVIVNNAVHDLDKENLCPDGISGKNILRPNLAKYLDAYQTSPSPTQLTTNLVAGRKRLRRIMRSKSLSSRQKCRSPSPSEYEYNKRADANGDFSLVGQSLPSLTQMSPPTWNPMAADVLEPKKLSSVVKHSVDEGSQTSWYEFESCNTNSNKSSKQTGILSNSGIVSNSDVTLKLRQSILQQKSSMDSEKSNSKMINFVTCIPIKLKNGPVGKWPPPSETLTGGSVNLKTDCFNKNYSNIHTSNDDSSNGAKTVYSSGQWNSDKFFAKDYNFSKFVTQNSKQASPKDSTLSQAESFTSLKTESKWQPSLTKSSDISAMIEDASCTMRSVLDQINAPITDPDRTMSYDPVGKVVNEPLSMGCSSQVPDTEIKTKLHYIHNVDDDFTASSRVKVLTALDHDVYTDYQHKKYRDTVSIGTLNTVVDKPRLHFIKVRVKDDNVQDR
ncbi:hypothetical protein Btru_006753 [Bulinus truncatus]|nr:hypothetical protein Btru_006753 [Bulinus truncatus]